MKLLILSDLHLEFAPFEAPKTDADVIILAGDTDIGLRGVEWARLHFPTKPVLYILGNHEYYTKAYPKLITELKNQTQDSTIHVLENDAVTIDDVTFLGCTLWTDFNLFGNPRISGITAMQTMTDYKKIRVIPNLLR